ncbi:globin-like protein [Tothia fuscella]|uniref:nitric oxide dioxygenase n=1 Tax=Tothia fuscella TaxID=1048955 RepID=A0A9P4NZP0_9PEZI|nr:globin-like protein [Tothia fuscella]
MPLTAEQTRLVKSTVPVLKEHGTTVTKLFYDNLLDAHPELKNIFNEANQVHLHQPKALAHAVYAYAAHLDDLGALSATVELIAHKHASLYVQPEHYAIVGKYLLEAMQQVLGEAMTPELLDAWTAAYFQLADIFVKKEKGMYETAAKRWTDWKDFRITKKIVESDEITSFYLEPVDEGLKPLPKFLPGQYISVQMEVPILGHDQTRQYSLSDAPWPNHYRISVKREGGLDPHAAGSKAHPGLVSNILHDNKNVGDTVRVSHPRGDFFMEPAHAGDDSPLVFISGGVGLTALTSILNSLVAGHATREISWLHAARTSDARAFTQHVRDIEKARKNVHTVFFDATPKKEHIQGKDYDHEGRMDLTKLDRELELHLSDPKTEYFVCGAPSFMVNMEKALMGYGVNSDRIKMELFGTGGIPRAS